ncbi:related to amino acid transport protein GAP1 [Phialocephala subalpina]|uniref:Related to amino acid transport protein GAP1 n=1 Tax=Phialocephala subalpina TaxID=576137 RepID=A0A1L7X8P4_9HELO|nr:related to amino acid transport protein GAP1 [Phialocephala subalpina]
MMGKSEKDISPQTKSPLPSEHEGVTYVVGGEEEERHGNGELRRNLSRRLIHIISLGSQIGSGLFIATGKALRSGGPGSLVLGYGMVCTCVWAALQTLSEMTIAFPVSGNFIDYADRFVDPALAFGAGFAEWLGWTAVVASEATFFSVIINYWANEKVHEAVWLSVFLVLCGGIFLLSNKWWGYFEYAASVLKILALIIFILAGFAMILGAGPTGKKHTGETWRDYPVFLNGFKGFANSALLGIWAMGDQVFTGIMGGEAKSPRYSMAHATKLVPIRVSVTFMLSIAFISILVPEDDPRLFGGSDTAASPFVIALDHAGIKGLPDFLNVVIMIGIAAIAVESIYISSRVLRAMAAQGLIPSFIARVDSTGRPRWAVAITVMVAVILTYMNLSATGTTVFTWLVSITSSSFFIVWFVICITSWRFRAALKAQNDQLFTEVYAHRTWAWPIPVVWLFAGSTVLLVSCIYIGLYPIGVSTPSVYYFFEYMIGVVIVLTFTIGYKIIYKTKIRDPKTADLKTGRRTLGKEEIDMLNEYYSRSTLKRFWTYVQLW